VHWPGVVVTSTLCATLLSAVAVEIVWSQGGSGELPPTRSYVNGPTPFGPSPVKTSHSNPGGPSGSIVTTRAGAGPQGRCVRPSVSPAVEPFKNRRAGAWRCPIG